MIIKFSQDDFSSGVSQSTTELIVFYEMPIMVERMNSHLFITSLGNSWDRSIVFKDNETCTKYFDLLNLVLCYSETKSPEMHL